MKAVPKGPVGRWVQVPAGAEHVTAGKQLGQGGSGLQARAAGACEERRDRRGAPVGRRRHLRLRDGLGGLRLLPCCRLLVRWCCPFRCRLLPCSLLLLLLFLLLLHCLRSRCGCRRLNRFNSCRRPRGLVAYCCRTCPVHLRLASSDLLDLLPLLLLLRML